jgi:tRNA dimethylallyltransferase
MESFLDGKLNGEPLDTLEKKKHIGLEEINIATRQYARYQSRWIRQKGLKSFKERNAMDHLYLLDSTNANEFLEKVLELAADICRQYLAGEKRPQPRDVSDAECEILSTLSNDDTTAPTIFKVKKCEICNMSLVTEDEWLKHINGKRHRRGIRTKKYTALVPVEDKTLLPAKIITETTNAEHYIELTP